MQNMHRGISGEIPSRSSPLREGLFNIGFRVGKLLLGQGKQDISCLHGVLAARVALRRIQEIFHIPAGEFVTGKIHEGDLHILSRSGHDGPAIDADGLTRNVFRLLRCEIGHHACYVFRRLRPSQGRQVFRP